MTSVDPCILMYILIIYISRRLNVVKQYTQLYDSRNVPLQLFYDLFPSEYILRDVLISFDHSIQ